MHLWENSSFSIYGNSIIFAHINLYISFRILLVMSSTALEVRKAVSLDDAFVDYTSRLLEVLQEALPDRKVSGRRRRFREFVNLPGNSRYFRIKVDGKKVIDVEFAYWDVFCPFEEVITLYDPSLESTVTRVVRGINEEPCRDYKIRCPAVARKILS